MIILKACLQKKLHPKNFIDKNLKQENLYYIHPSSFADEGCKIGAGTKVWHFCHIMPSAVIGQNCNIGQNVFIGDGVKIGDSVKVQNNVSLYSGVICEDFVFIGPSVVFTNIKNPRSSVPRKDQYATTLVKRGASIGANATIVCGLTIGEFAFIGAGSVVTRDVPAYGLITGNPGKITGWMSEYGHRLRFENNKAICPESGQIYIFKENNQVEKIS